jgi:translation initiation factor 1 (eIF-1/SUI1)
MWTTRQATPLWKGNDSKREPRREAEGLFVRCRGVCQWASDLHPKLTDRTSKMLALLNQTQSYGLDGVARKGLDVTAELQSSLNRSSNSRRSPARSTSPRGRRGVLFPVTRARGRKAITRIQHLNSEIDSHLLAISLESQVDIRTASRREHDVTRTGLHPLRDELLLIATGQSQTIVVAHLVTTGQPSMWRTMFVRRL